MNADTLEKLFEPFFTTKKLGEGTGLGLATVYGIVKQNQGFINVYSEVDEGTVFHIYLPCQTGPLDSVQAAPNGKTRFGEGRTVLVVEDNPAIMDLASRMLNLLDFQALGATSPRQAIELADDPDQDIHLVLTDVILPEMNGRNLLRKLQEKRPDLKCLFMSGYSANVISQKGILDLGLHFLQKPFVLSDLARAIQSTLKS